MTTAIAHRCCVERRRLVRALEHLRKIISGRGSKPMLHCVRLETTGHHLKLAATDLETSLTLQIEAEGELPVTVVLCDDLLQRVKTGRGPVCELTIDESALLVNGGAVHHRLQTEDPREYPVIPVVPHEKRALVNVADLRQALRTALIAVARESTRYAINGVQLEIGATMHAVATDGRRLVSIPIANFECDAAFNLLLPARFCQALIRLMDRDDEGVAVCVRENKAENGDRKPSDVCVHGPDWTLHTLELDGLFPQWREIVPRDGSRFLVDRVELLNLVKEVSTAAGEMNQGMRLRLDKESVTATCRSGSGAESWGRGACRYMGGGDSLIVTGFNPQFLEDLLASLTSTKVLVRVRQNTPTSHNSVAHHAAVFSPWPGEGPQWVVMPVNTEAKPSVETLGSNYPEPAAA